MREGGQQKVRVRLLFILDRTQNFYLPGICCHGYVTKKRFVMSDYIIIIVCVYDKIVSKEQKYGAV